MAWTATETTKLAQKKGPLRNLAPHGRQYTETTEKLTGSQTTTEKLTGSRTTTEPIKINGTEKCLSTEDSSRALRTLLAEVRHRQRQTDCVCT